MMLWAWLAGVGVPLVAVGVDLLPARRGAVLSTERALDRLALWLGGTAVFGVSLFVACHFGVLELDGGGGPPLAADRATFRFFASWLLQACASFDVVLFVAFVMTRYRIPTRDHQRILFGALLGAAVLRGLALGLGMWLVPLAGWLVYPLGVVLLFAAAQLMLARHDTIQPRRSLALRLLLRRAPLAEGAGERAASLFVEQGGARRATRNALALTLAISSTAIFAVASVPAAFAFTTDPLLAASAAAFGLLAPRSLFYAVVSYLPRLRYFKLTQGLVLAYLAVRTFLEPALRLPSEVSLASVGVLLVLGGVASFLSSDPETRRLISPIADELEELGEVTLRQLRRALVLLVGTVLIAVGVALVPFPPPGSPNILLGLTILATEFPVALRLKSRLTSTLKALLDRVRAWRGRPD